MRPRFPVALCTLAALLPPARTADPQPVRDDEQTLAAAKLPTDPASLVRFFRQRTPNDADRAKVEALIRRLGDDRFAEREKASRDLVEVGPVALPLLRGAASGDDLEVRRRARECIRQIEAGPGAAAAAAAARLLAHHKPPETTAVLLAYLPFVEDDYLAGELRQALAAVAVRDGKADATLLQSLVDPLPVKRAAAGEALAHASPADQLATVRPLLQDREPLVRLRVALALAERRERDAIPVLVALLAELPSSAAWEVEDLLRSLAGEQAPAVPLGSDDVGRRACRDAWAAWWKEHGDRVDWARLQPGQRVLGYTLLVMQVDKAGGGGRVVEIDRDGRPRWSVGGLGYPLDAHVLPGNRVLIVEGGRVGERTFKGDLIWEAPAADAIAAQRLPDGNTFIVTRGRLFEVDRARKEVWSHKLAGVMCGLKLRTGQVACLAGGQYLLLDTSGKVLKSWPVPDVLTVGGLDALPSGGIVVAQVYANKVVEYDAAGKVVWEAAVDHPTSVVRLRNGRTLVAAWDTGRVVELSPQGKVVWEHKANAEYSRARRR